MRSRALLSSVLALVALAVPVIQRSAQADLGASGSRLAIGGGAPRFYMTYGHIEEPELYAPIIPELARVQVSVQRQGNDYYGIYHKGVKVDEWPVVKTRDDVPETGEHPCVLVMGGNVFLPVRKLSELCGFSIKWDKKANLIALTPDLNKKPVAMTPANHQPAPVVEVGAATLSGVTVEEKAGGVLVHVKSDFPLRPVWHTVHSPAPVRLVVDFPNARWANGVNLPAGAGPVTGFKVGHPNPGTARLVMVVPSTAFKLTGLQVTQGEIVASVGAGREVAKVEVVPEVRAALQGRLMATNRLPSRSGDDLPPGGGGTLLPPIGSPRLTLPSLNATALAGKVICVDAGHGGHSAGALGLDYQEKDLTLKMAQQFQRALEACGATVVMTRTNDDFVSLEDRCQIATSRNVDLFISIHCNSTPHRNSASGSETYFTTPQSLPLAQAMHRRLVGAVRKRDGGIRTCRFYVCRNVSMPSVLLEIAYINNAEDERLMAGSDFRGDLAQSLCAGVVEYFYGR